MKIGITKLLPENIAPSDVKSLAIFKGDKKICDIDISKMTPSNLGTKLYSFGLLSDIHMTIWGDIDNVAMYESAINRLYGMGCDFVCITGDLTNTGFHAYENDATKDEVNWYDEQQFKYYQQINALHPDMPVYGCCGNHESYVKLITENLSDLVKYTGNEFIEYPESEVTENTEGLIFTVSQGDDLFIFVGQSEGNIPMSKDHFEWLSETLEANRNKRCFVFIHPFIDTNDTKDSGNPLGLHSLPLFNNPNITDHGYNKHTFIEMMVQYPNAILFHGHSHMRFENQEAVSNANYSTNLGFKSVHVPSTAYCRDIRSGAVVKQEIAQGYIVDVYTNHIVLKGYSFTDGTEVPIAQYCIDTRLVDVSAAMFADSTGTIVT